MKFPIHLIDVAYPPDSLGLGMLWVSEHGRTVFTEMISMEECMFLSDAEQEVLDDIISGPFGASLEVVDGKFLAAGRDKVMLFGIHKGREPMLIGFADLKGRIEEIRAAHNHVYVSMKGNKTYTVDVTDPANMTIVGSHEVAYWVQGLEVSDSRAFLLDGNRLGIALIHENGGWLW